MIITASSYSVALKCQLPQSPTLPICNFGIWIWTWRRLMPSRFPLGFRSQTCSPWGLCSGSWKLGGSQVRQGKHGCKSPVRCKRGWVEPCPPRSTWSPTAGKRPIELWMSGGQAVQLQPGPHWTPGHQCLPSRLSWGSRASWHFPLEGKRRRGWIDGNPSSIFMQDESRCVAFLWNMCIPLTVIFFPQMQVQTGVGLRGKAYDPIIKF